MMVYLREKSRVGIGLVPGVLRHIGRVGLRGALVVQRVGGVRAFHVPGAGRRALRQRKGFFKGCVHWKVDVDYKNDDYVTRISYKYFQ